MNISNMNLMPAPVYWEPLLPMLAVFGAGVLAMTSEIIWPKRTNNVIVLICLLGLAVGGGLIILDWSSGLFHREPMEFFGLKFGDGSDAFSGGLFIHDRFGQVVQLLLIAVTFLTVLFSEGYLRERKIPFGEYYPLILWSAVGGMIMVTTRDLIIFFLGLETLSIALYVLAGLNSSEKRSQESALKYFLLGAFASSFLLFGIALIYGATGTTHVSGIEMFMAKQPLDPTLIKVLFGGIALSLIGFAFKAALVPFHMWTPDVYQGAPTSVTAFMAAGSKVAAFCALVRFLGSANHPDLSSVWLPALAVLAVLTMTVGNLIALAQRDAKRMLGYSSIAQAGYLLVAVIAWSAHPELIGTNTVVFYLAAYSLMTVGAFAVLSLTAQNGHEGTQLEDYYGLWKRAPFAAAAMIVFLASLAGVPPTGGFVGKFLIFRDAIEADYTWLAIVLGVNSVISAFYYLRLVMAVCVKEPELRETKFSKQNPGLFSTTAICMVAVLAMGILAGPVIKWIGLQGPSQTEKIERTVATKQ